MKMQLLINEDTNHVIVRITEKELGKIIEKIQKSTGLSKKQAKNYWARKMSGYAQKHYNAPFPIDFEVL